MKAWVGHPGLTSRGIVRGRHGQAMPVPAPGHRPYRQRSPPVTRITAPSLTLSVRPDAPAREVNVGREHHRFQIRPSAATSRCCFNCAANLRTRAFRVRLIVTDECDFRPVTWGRQFFATFPGLEDFLERIELVYAFDRRTVIPVGPRRHLPGHKFGGRPPYRPSSDAPRSAKQKVRVPDFRSYEPGFYPFGSLAAARGRVVHVPALRAVLDGNPARTISIAAGHGVLRLRSRRPLERAAFQKRHYGPVGPVIPPTSWRRKRNPQIALLLFAPKPHAPPPICSTNTGHIHRSAGKAVQAGGVPRPGSFTVSASMKSNSKKSSWPKEVYMDMLPRPRSGVVSQDPEGLRCRLEPDALAAPEAWVAAGDGPRRAHVDRDQLLRQQDAPKRLAENINELP